MPEDQWVGYATIGNGPRYDHALAAAILIVTVHLDPSLPEEIRFSRIIFEILSSMYRAEEELARARWEPGEN